MKKVAHKAQRQPVAKKLSVDALFRNTTRTLIRDFQATLDDPCFSKHVLEALTAKDVKALRAVKGKGFNFDLPVNHFKAQYQIDSLDKRYRYQMDAYTDVELEDMAKAKFQEVQDRLQGLDWDDIIQDESMIRILSLARRFCRQVLGDMDPDELRESARFGTGATVGVKASDAHLAQRFMPPITGTPEQISWWRSEYDHCPHFQHWMCELGFPFVERQDQVYREVSSLKLTFVPKSFKSLRAIMPNTTIGAYISGGLGEMIRKRLKEKLNLDIRKLQHKHRELSQFESMMRTHCTVDLSSASDTVSRTLVELLLPTDWFKALSLGGMHVIEVPGHSTVEVETFSTMGVGSTFTLQTLIFYSLIWAVRAVEEYLSAPHGLRRYKSYISVYGDDLIFGSKLYPGVVRVLERLGMEVNDAKSFVDVPFRESCGGDYYHGRDVRPFQPEVAMSLVSIIDYEALIYKFINGLRARWTCDHEIWSTLQYLVAEIERQGRSICLVPKDYPEDSGIRISGNCFGAVEIPSFLDGARLAKPMVIGHGVYRFHFLKKISERKEELRHGPYYWSALRGCPLISSTEFGKGHDFDRFARLVPLLEPTVLRTGGLSYVVLEKSEPRVGALITRHLAPEGSPDIATPGYGGGKAFTGPPNLTKWETRAQADYVDIPHTGKYRRQRGTSTFRGDKS